MNSYCVTFSLLILSRSAVCLAAQAGWKWRNGVERLWNIPVSFTVLNNVNAKTGKDIYVCSGVVPVVPLSCGRFKFKGSPLWVLKI